MLIIPSPKADPDSIALALARCANLARGMPPSWDGARITVPCTGMDGGYFGKALPGKGLYLAFDRNRLGLTKLPPFVYEPTPVQHLIDHFRYAMPRQFAGHAFYDKRTHSIVHPEQAAIATLAQLAAIAAMAGGAACGLPVFQGAVTTYDSILTARGAGTGAPMDIVSTKASDTTVANAWHSLWQVAGIPTLLTYSALGAGSAPTNANAGAWSLGLANPTVPNKRYLLTFGFTAAQQINMAILVDLLIEVGSIVVNSAGPTDNTLNTTALTRYTNGKGVLIAFEVTTVLTATAGTVDVNSYTDQDGNTGSNGPTNTMVNSAAVHRLVGGSGSGTATVGSPFYDFASGDYGVRAISTIATGGATAGTGRLALNMVFPLSFVPGVAAQIYMERDSTVQIDGLMELTQTSGNVLGCLGLYILPNTTTSGQLTAFQRTCEG